MRGKKRKQPATHFRIEPSTLLDRETGPIIDDSLNSQLKTLSTVMNDLEFAFRQLPNNPGFTTPAALMATLSPEMNNE